MISSGVTIVSNRLPVSVRKVNGKLEYKPSDGGLASGLSSYVKDKKNRWIGWPGIDSEQLTDADKVAITRHLARSNCYPVFLTKHQQENYYNGYSNEVLWPLLHNMPIADHKQKYWKTYREVNSIFAEAILKNRKSGSTVWVHDYHLMLVPRMLRDSNKLMSIGFFLHTPFPVNSHFDNAPEARQLIKGLLGSNMIGFHTNKYVHNFLECCSEMQIGTVLKDQVILADRTIRVGVFPIGIDYSKFAEAHKSLEVKKHVKRLRAAHRRQKVILTVDRLDPTKGFIERLNAYNQLLKTTPEIHTKVVMLMLAIPTREQVDYYKKLKIEVEKLVTRINKTHGTDKWQPIKYMYQTVPFEELAAMYQIADVAFVAPKRDGMNLVAKEYVASQSGAGGVLILSETAGAAEELRDAVLVNPTRPSALVKGLVSALNMPRNELKKRVGMMQSQISSNTINSWVTSFVDTLQTPVSAPSLTRQLTAKAKSQIVEEFKNASKRTILCDYDGTLVSFANDPSAAKPPVGLKKLLTKLGTTKNTEVAVISGRSQTDMQNWLGDLPITLVTEHGASIRQRGKNWQNLIDSAGSWKDILLPALQKFAEDTPRAFVEEKNFSLVWHYRAAPPYQAQKNIVILKQSLRPVTEKLGLKIYTGHKIIEIKPPELNKGVVARDYLIKDHDFVLIVGDDYTDEEIFKTAPDHAITIKVGRGRTAAKYRTMYPGEVLNFLNQLAS